MDEPRGRYFEELDVGTVFESRARRVTASDIQAFADLTGDHNPLHVDPEFAATTPYGDIIAHGLLGLSLIIGLFEDLELFHGTALAFLGISDWRFRGPIMVDDEVCARMLIEQKRRSSSDSSRGIITRRLELFNARGDLLQDGTAAVLVRCREAAV